jgi:hypothetical protein
MGFLKVIRQRSAFNLIVQYDRTHYIIRLHGIMYESVS